MSNGQQPNRAFVYDLRFSLTSVELLPDLLGGSSPRGGDASLFLGTPEAYEDALARAKRHEGRLRPPWRADEQGSRGHFVSFWALYLNSEDYHLLADRQLKRLLTPVRLEHGHRARVDGGGGGETSRVGVEAYLYPHGIATVVTLSLGGRRSLGEAVDRALAARKATCALTSPDGSSAQMPANALAGAVRKAIRKELTGSDGVGLVLTPQPVSVAAIVRGEGFPTGQVLADGSEVHRALDGLCTFSDSWRTDQPRPVAQAVLETKGSTPDKVLYQRGRGRALWFPAKLSVQAKRSRTIACYRRNQDILAMQVESLLAFVRWGAEELRAARQPHPAVVPMLKEATNVLARLYGGASDTYRSVSALKQIDDSGLRGDVEFVRTHFGSPGPLHAGS